VERGLGDVLLSWENEAYLAVKEFGADKFEIVNPSSSVLAEPPVAVVDANVDRHGTRKVAEAYLNYLYTDAGQEIAAKNFYRPRSQTVLAKYRSQFPDITLFTIGDVTGTWTETQQKHFADHGLFDQLYKPQS
jgi:sulfate transport system substrate-binding protein